MTTPNETNDTKTPKTQRPMFWMRAIEGRKNRLTRDYRRTLGDSAREGISDEDYATTMATLEKMARNLGWDESQPEEHGFGPHFGHPHGHHGPRGHRGHRRGLHPDERDDATLPNETPEA